MAGFKLMTPAEDPALDIAAVKRQLNIDESDTMFDDEINDDLIPPAIELAEKHTARSLASQGWRQYFDCFPGCEHSYVAGSAQTRLRSEFITMTGWSCGDRPAWR